MTGAGKTALTVHCLGCYHQAVKTFEELKLWNAMIFVDDRGGATTCFSAVRVKYGRDVGSLNFTRFESRSAF